MAGVYDLQALLLGMKPKLQPGEYVFCVVSEVKFRTMNIKPLCTFREKEGVTAILDLPSANGNSIQYSGVWRMISLNVHSDLGAVGFLAAITAKLAKANIPCNVISAYHHDNLFVPKDRVGECMELLKSLQAQGSA